MGECMSVSEETTRTNSDQTKLESVTHESALAGSQSNAITQSLSGGKISDDLKVFRDEELYDLILAYFHFGDNQRLIDNASSNTNTNTNNTNIHQNKNNAIIITRVFFILPHDIIWLISTYQMNDLIIDSGTCCTLQSGIEYKFSSIHLKVAAILTVDEWDPQTKEGGILWINCGSVTLDRRASIHVNGKGFPGAINMVGCPPSEHMTHQAFMAAMNNSSNRNNASQKKANRNHALFLEHGMKLGDGGQGHKYGGCGGGCIRLLCDELQMEYASITALPTKGFDYKTGGGGRIHLTVRKSATVTDVSKCKIWSDCPRSSSSNNGSVLIECPHPLKEARDFRLCPKYPTPRWTVL